MMDIITVSVPVNFKRQGVRRLIISPDNSADQSLTVSQAPDENMINALVKAWHWQKMADSGQFKSIGEMAQKEGVTSSYMSRILRLNSLAPDIKLAILNGTHPRTLQITDLMPQFSEIWAEQRKVFRFPEK